MKEKMANLPISVYIAISVILSLLTVVVNYIPISNFVLWIMMLLGVLSSIFIGIKISYNYKVNRFVTFIVALILIIGIHFLAAFLFESGNVFIARDSLFNKEHSVVRLYSMFAVFVLEEIVRYIIYIQKRKKEKFMKNILKKYVSIALAVVLINSSLFSTTISLAESENIGIINNDIKNSYSESKFKDLSEESIYLILNAVNDMPKEILDRGNQKEINDYMLSKGVDIIFEDEEDVSSLKSFWGCVASIVWAVGTTALGVGILLKLKKFIAAAGGVKAAATALIAIAKEGATSENITKFGETLVSIGGTILGIKQIKEECL